MKKRLTLVLLAIALSSTATLAATGEETYKTKCFYCHAFGASNAPKLTDKAAWAPRLAKGEDALVTSAINGVPGTAMPARGGHPSLADTDLKAAVQYMMKEAE